MNGVRIIDSKSGDEMYTLKEFFLAEINGITIIDSKSGDEMYTPKEFFPDYIWKKIENREQLTEEESKIVDDIIFGGSSVYVPNPFGSVF